MAKNQPPYEYKFIKNGIVMFTTEGLSEYNALMHAKEHGLKEGIYNIKSTDRNLRKDTILYVCY